jgi:hypothetical protein
MEEEEKKTKLLRSSVSDPVCYCFIFFVIVGPSYCGGPYGPNDPWNLCKSNWS